MIKSNKSKKSKSSRKNPRMETRGRPEQKFGRRLKDIAKNLDKEYLNYTDEYQLWLSTKQEKRLKFIITDLLDLSAELG